MFTLAGPSIKALPVLGELQAECITESHLPRNLHFIQCEKNEEAFVTILFNDEYFAKIGYGNYYVWYYLPNTIELFNFLEPKSETKEVNYD